MNEQFDSPEGRPHTGGKRTLHTWEETLGPLGRFFECREGEPVRSALHDLAEEAFSLREAIMEGDSASTVRHQGILRTYAEFRRFDERFTRRSPDDSVATAVENIIKQRSVEILSETDLSDQRRTEAMIALDRAADCYLAEFGDSTESDSSAISSE